MSSTIRKVVYDPLTELMSHYAAQKAEKKEAAGAAAPVEERLKRRIIDGDRVGLNADLDEALKAYPALEIINTILLDGMKVVGELFGSGQMQLPFVLQSAEVMKAAVAYLEQYMDKATSTSKGSMVIATVKGDVHDIGKNLVDIILTNNGYRVINLGIKCPLETMLHALAEHHADALGMSGLLVKSTLIMKENLEVMNEQGVAVPVVLGGAALTRRYVEQTLRPLYRGKVFYANDAFAGLHFMEQLKNGTLVYPEQAPEAQEEETLTGTEAKIALAERENERYRTPAAPAAPLAPATPLVSATPLAPATPVASATPSGSSATAAGPSSPASRRRSSVRPAEFIPVPPFWGTRVIEEVPLDDVFAFVNDVALIRGQWQVKKGKLKEEEYQRVLEERIYPEYSALREQIKREGLLGPKAVYGYFPCNSDGDDLIIYGTGSTIGPSASALDPAAAPELVELTRFTFPRQTGDRFLCLSDYFAAVSSGVTDVVAFQLVTMGRAASEHSAELFNGGDYKKYLYFHGLSVESTEAMAELWHKKIREELGIAGKDAADMRRLFSQGYQGSRYSFGYPACPNLEDQTKLFALLDGERIGVRLTDEFSLDPEQSTNAIIVHHGEARYFNIK